MADKGAQDAAALALHAVDDTASGGQWKRRTIGALARAIHALAVRALYPIPIPASAYVCGRPLADSVVGNALHRTVCTEQYGGRFADAAGLAGQPQQHLRGAVAERDRERVRGVRRCRRPLQPEQRLRHPLRRPLVRRTVAETACFTFVGWYSTQEARFGRPRAATLWSLPGSDPQPARLSPSGCQEEPEGSG